MFQNFRITGIMLLRCNVSSALMRTEFRVTLPSTYLISMRINIEKNALSP